jgi:lipopolysaccharide transport system permease protein
MDQSEWDLIIEPDNKKTGKIFNELFRYKDLILMFVKRDFISLYKQTVLGPLWVVIQPILTTITFYIVFGRIAEIGTGEIPQILFYMLGITTWTYFSDCVLKTSETFSANQNIFGKVYFPRMVTPLSIIITNLIKLGIQLVLFLVLFIYYKFFTENTIAPNWKLLLTPILILNMAIFGLGIGLIISSLTTKYRDLKFLIVFGVQLAMYATPIVYPLTKVTENYRWILQLNPMTNIIETFKEGFFGEGSGYQTFFGIDYGLNLIYSFLISIIILIIGSKLFNKVERSFMDTI